ncbi:actin-related protein 8 isoform X2 [Condylostylus longicornis]|uniref:actin-related protein 8 isoform X2 n=1 Tax=Condylostylus longicornis TaxID=2530218 RepID=UPI00244DDB02|nr:actin-related protein 8 isoform X2 [Condylostylus longicornis]
MPPVSECPEQLQAQMIIVIHPGSLNLRMGRASDLNPIRILHAVARKRRLNGVFYRDSFLPACVERSQELMHEFEECRLQVSHTLQSCLQSDGRRRYATPPQQISAFNRRSTAECIDDNAMDIPVPDKEIIFGDEIINVKSDLAYNLHFPFRKGDLNLHGNVGGSLSAVLADLQAIWEYALSEKMNIKLSDLSQYKAVLVVSDIYNRSHLKELTTMLLIKMGFGSCFLVQDHVAATFGAGLGYACVIDVGDQKTSVSCVEDGISHPSTRVRLEYGGGDVTQTFYYLLQKCAFPYKECDNNNIQDALLLKKLKEDYCHVNLDICGSQEKNFTVKSNKKIVKYTIQLGDECIVAPLALFNTELLNITGKNKTARVQKPSAIQPDSEDCFDSSYIRETGRRSGREQLEPIQGGDGAIITADNQDDDIVVDTLEAERDVKPTDKEFVLPGGQIVGLDQAVIQTTEELKRKMFSCILVVGGGMKFPEISKWLHNRVSLQIPYLHRTEQLEIVSSNIHGMDPAITSWKGAAIMSCLESAPELWISSMEWKKYGLRILREKAAFMW